MFHFGEVVFYTSSWCVHLGPVSHKLSAIMLEVLTIKLKVGITVGVVTHVEYVIGLLEGNKSIRLSMVPQRLGVHLNKSLLS